ncbi:MAG: Gfo/Idh/MocA family oxidoreductase [Pirellulaceae bacterium]|jgi:predicted dehydrogenase|nr:Gfo/Idh/MocA family oxidoreductase [Pirellulaceae bacterium]
MSQNSTSRESARLTNACSRRGFLAGAGAVTAAGITILRPELVRGYAANEKVDIGIIGCGGRGVWIAELFHKHGGYNIVAATDYFQDRVDDLGNKLNVPSQARYIGLAGYKRLLQQQLDAIVIESPPYFHPEQAAAGVEAGKHVYLAKPIAVDVAGCKTVEASGQKATAAGLCFLVDFQTRADRFYLEAIQRVRDGAIGTFAFGESTYHADVPWVGQIPYAREAATNPESRLRAWGVDRVLSGDIITEQNIHTIDVASWIMDQPPLCAFGTGARKVRDYGDCCDTFSVTFQYPDNVGIAFSSRQFPGHGTQPEGIRNRMFGTQGVLETSYGGPVMIRGDNFWRGGESPAIYEEGAVTNIAAFHQNILAKECANPTVPASVRSNLVTILGRTSAYRGEVVHWDQLLASNDRLEFNTKGLKS